jgi:hypothetical protein
MADGHELAVHVREQMRAAVSNVRAGLSAGVLAVDDELLHEADAPAHERHAADQPEEGPRFHKPS